MHARRRTGWCRFSLALTQNLHACLVISMVKLYYYCMVTLVLTSATSLQATGATEPASKQNQEWIVDRAHIPVQVLRRPGRMEILCGGAAQCTWADGRESFASFEPAAIGPHHQESRALQRPAIEPAPQIFRIDRSS